jgi:hypothetical protein
MDSKAVDALLRPQIWRALSERGFARRTGRTAWRDGRNGIQVVNVQSFNSYLAEVLHVTSFSFAVKLGVFYPAIAAVAPQGRFVADPTRPKEHDCQARRTVEKTMAQDHVGADRGWIDRPDIWYVLGDGSNLDDVVADASERVLTVGLPWLGALDDLGVATRRFLEERNRYAQRGVIAEHYGGKLGSPFRMRSAAALAAAAGDTQLLRDVLTAIADDPYWAKHPDDRARLDQLAHGESA